MTKLKTALAQLSPEKDNIEKNIATAASYIKSAAESNADLIIFPEQYFNNWDPLCTRYSREEQDGIIAALKDEASANGIAVLGSYYKAHNAAENAGDNADSNAAKDGTGKNNTPKENTSVFIDDCGKILAEYSKIHLFSPAGEDIYFVAGDRPAVCTYDGFKFGLTICYDLRFPELFRYYAEIGCNCVINQSAWAKARMEQRRILSRARAVENQYYFIGVNIAGKNPQDEYFGESNVIDPAGTAVLEADGTEGLFFAEIDSECVIAVRENLPILSDRRESLYMEWRRKFIRKE
ncbi:MAG: carbon-nitrogen hydrolase family protein [Methanomicrobium sp.]|nr:carbon-nitrogen hydrolase family protein [Methanomicrobium sp.]